jgi:phthalate 4,5-dioxygenase oxygenase subunit
MLSHQDNDLLCRIGPGTAMGTVFRRYWIPALQASELARGNADPVHVELLGEHFVTFRNDQGTVGFLDERCCHRGASLLLGRVEASGIRCIYHGWKFAPDGTVLETPNVPDQNFKTRFRARAYPVREAGGLIWVYLGPPSMIPSFPTWRWFSAGESNRLNTRHIHGCNYLQVLEGLLDSSHLGILHSNGLNASQRSDLTFANKVGAMQFDLAPRIDAQDTDFGFHYAAIRAGTGASSAKAFVRVTAFVCPFTVLNPNGDVATIVVPRNDESSNFYHVFWDAERAIGEEPLRSEQLRFIGLDTDTASAYRITEQSQHLGDKPCRGNRFLQNRKVMSTGESFSGLPGLIEEDVAVSVSAGPIRDRTKESLSIADVAIGRLYRSLLRCARLVQGGQPPIGLEVDVTHVAGISQEIDSGRQWQSLVPTHLSAAEDSRPGAASG